MKIIGRKLHLVFIIKEEGELSPKDFIGMFEWAEDLSRHLMTREAYNLFEYLDLSSQTRIETIGKVYQLASRAPSPAEVKNIERGSWIVEVFI